MATSLKWASALKTSKAGRYNNEVTNMTDIQSSKEAALRKNRKPFE